MITVSRWRIDLVITLHDRFSDKLNRMSNLSEKANAAFSRTRRAAQMLDQQKIAPFLTVRDQLTASVQKASHLVRGLDKSHASPVIAAQDRVSSVVNRMNAALEALEKGKFNVVAEMKGPLMEEIARANSAISVLSKVDVKPVAVLHGSLTAQLTKALAEVERLDQFTAEPKANLRDRVTWKASEVGYVLRELSYRAWTVTIEAKEKVTGVVKRITGALASPLGMLGAGAGVAGLIGYPLKLAGEMEQANIAMETMLGSSERAQQFLSDLADFAVKTPFEMPQLRDASRRLLAFGFSAESVIPTLTALGDAASGLGLGEEGLNRIVLALGQMRAKSKVSADEMLQLTEAGIPAWDILSEKMGMATADVMKLSEKGLIPASQAINMLVSGMEERFPKMMERQSRSLFGLISSLKDFANLKFFWAFGEGIRQAAVPALQRFIDMLSGNEQGMKKVQERLMELGRTVGTWVVGKFEALYRWFEKLSSDETFNKMSFGDKLIYVLNQGLDAVNNWLSGSGGKKVQEMFVKLGEIAAKAWLTGISGMVKGSGEAFLHGNILGGIGLLAGVGMLGGGMLLRGAWGLGKGILSTGRGAMAGIDKFMVTRAASRAAALETTNPLAAQILRGTYGAMEAPAAASTTAATAAARTAQVAQTASRAAQTTSDTAQAVSAATRGIGGGLSSRVLPVLGKVALPLAVGAELVGIARAQDKVAATAQAAGGLGGSLVGAKLGALAGTAILPGIGTIVGGALGGIGGYIAGRWFGGKAVEAARQPAEDYAAMPDMTRIMQPAIEAANKVSAILGSFGVYLQGQADAVISNLTQMAKQAWNIVAIKTAFAANLQKQADLIISYMDQMGQQTWNIIAIETAFAVNLQNVADSIIAGGNALAGALSSAASQAASFRVPYTNIATPAPAPHALGGILTRPHLGLVAEAGPEAVIPLSARLRPRALELWRETGRRLGVQQFEFGGFTAPVAVAGASMGAPMVNLNFDLAGLVGQITVQAREDLDQAADQIAAVIAAKLKAIFYNLPG